MNFIKRWRHRPEKDQEQLLVRLWTMNSMNADADGQLKGLLIFSGKRVLPAAFKAHLERSADVQDRRILRPRREPQRTLAVSPRAVPAPAPRHRHRRLNPLLFALPQVKPAE